MVCLVGIPTISTSVGRMVVGPDHETCHLTFAQ
jgi:hypothetical protein